MTRADVRRCAALVWSDDPRVADRAAELLREEALRVRRQGLAAWRAFCADVFEGGGLGATLALGDACD